MMSADDNQNSYQVLNLSPFLEVVSCESSIRIL